MQGSDLMSAIRARGQSEEERHRQEDEVKEEPNHVEVAVVDSPRKDQAHGIVYHVHSNPALLLTRPLAPLQKSTQNRLVVPVIF